jgi:hypothetical protein
LDRKLLVLSASIEQNDIGADMNTKKISDVEAFKKESDKARIIPLTKKDLKRINEICHEVEIEENESQDNNLPLIAKNIEDSIHPSTGLDLPNKHLTI